MGYWFQHFKETRILSNHQNSWLLVYSEYRLNRKHKIANTCAQNSHSNLNSDPQQTPLLTLSMHLRKMQLNLSPLRGEPGCQLKPGRAREAVARRVFHQYNNSADLLKPPKPNFTEGGGAASTPVKCVKRWRALLDYWDPCLAGVRKGASLTWQPGYKEDLSSFSWCHLFVNDWI